MHHQAGRSATRHTTKDVLKLGGIGAVLLVVFSGVQIWTAHRNAATFAPFWQAAAGAPVPVNAIRLVALGDSAVEAIGAARPMDGFVGRIAADVQAQTGRPVHITNVADGATYAEIVRRQLPKVDLTTADIVIIASSTDLETRVPLDAYRAALDALLQALPPDKTVVSDLPLLPGREPYQRILEERTAAHRIARADFARIFNHEGRRLDLFSWLLPHLNSKGYAYWFLAFKPGVDAILEDHCLTPGVGAGAPRSGRCAAARGERPPLPRAPRMIARPHVGVR